MDTFQLIIQKTISLHCYIGHVQLVERLVRHYHVRNGNFTLAVQKYDDFTTLPRNSEEWERRAFFGGRCFFVDRFDSTGAEKFPPHMRGGAECWACAWYPGILVWAVLCSPFRLHCCPVPVKSSWERAKASPQRRTQRARRARGARLPPRSAARLCPGCPVESGAARRRGSAGPAAARSAQSARGQRLTKTSNGGKPK